MEQINIKRPTLLEIIKTALYIGTIGYGGPAILALMKKTIVNEKSWISEEEFINALSLSLILPGATGVTLWGYIGHKLRKPWGGILAPLSFILPSMIAITCLGWAYFTYGDLKFVHSIFIGLGALVVALLINATLMMSKSVFPKTDSNSYKGLTITALSFLGITFLHLNVVYIILISGIFGAFFFYSTGEFEQGKIPGHLKLEIDIPKIGSLQDYLPLLIIVGVLAAIFLLVSGTWIIFVTFLKIGALAFGGGFATVPLIQNIVIDGMHWLNLTAFRDGIALGQITPGPIFITATFIGFKVKGIIGALVATIGIFTPSLAAIILLGRAHAKIKNMKIVKVIIKGFFSGFIGLLLAVVYQFGVHSLIGWQAWTIFAISVAYLIGWKKDAIWLILGIIGVSLLMF